jgi:Fe2+ or Zn2+ uptake regulation protein
MEIKDVNQSKFLQIMGDSPINRVLNFLVINEDFDYSLTDIAHNSKVGYATLYIFWNKLESAGIIKQTRVVGKAKMYKLNKQSQLAINFLKLYDSVVKLKLNEKMLVAVK